MLECIVEGTPRSVQGSGHRLNEWRAAVRAAAVAQINVEERFDYVDVSATIIHFCFDWGDTAGDLDNIAKPILDAVAGRAFFNDSQIFELVLRRTDFRRHNVTEVQGASPLLAERIGRALLDPDQAGSSTFQ